MIHVLTNPREAFAEALNWGTNDFDARPLADGIVLLLGLLPQTQVPEQPENDEFPLDEERKFLPELEADVTRSSARRRVIVNAAQGTFTLSFVGLHTCGFGLPVDNPLHFNAGIDGSDVPNLPEGVIVALNPVAQPKTDRHPDHAALPSPGLAPWPSTSP